jgi:hypothetical protein
MTDSRLQTGLHVVPVAAAIAAVILGIATATARSGLTLVPCYHRSNAA